MWYFELQPDYVESKYTPEFARTFAGLSVHVKNGSVSGYDHANSCGMQISGHNDMEFCL